MVAAMAYIGHMEPEQVSAHVAGIVESAERAAAQLREQAEARARERIAEGDRAAANRVWAPLAVGMPAI